MQSHDSKQLLKTIFCSTIFGALLALAVGGYGDPDPTTPNEIVPHSKSGTATNDTGTDMIIEYVLVAITEEASSETEAARLASLVNGRVIGKIKEMNIWQISVNATSIDDINAFIVILENEKTVHYAMTDFIITVA